MTFASIRHITNKSRQREVSNLISQLKLQVVAIAQERAACIDLQRRDQIAMTSNTNLLWSAFEDAQIASHWRRKILMTHGFSIPIFQRIYQLVH